MKLLVPARRQFARAIRISKQIIRGERTVSSLLRIARDRVHASRARTASARLQQWHEQQAPAAAELRRQRARNWPGDAPPVSILLPCPNAAIADIKATLASLKRQTYPHWRVHLAADYQHAAALRKLARRIIGEERLTVAASPTETCKCDLQSALQQADGEFVAVMTPGDELSPQALYELAGFLLENPACDAVYCDEDCVDPQKKERHNLRLKPDWSPEMLLGHNYVGRLCLLRRSTLADCGGFNTDLREAQEYDAILRISEHTDRIRRLPRCLYHRRAASQAASVPTAWDGSPALQAEAVRRHLSRRGYDATVAIQSTGMLRASWPIAAAPLVSIIIPTRDNLDVLKVCLEGLLYRTAYRNIEIILVDNGSANADVQRYYDMLGQTQGVRIVDYHQRFNYSQACNLGARAARGDVLLFLNDDTEVIRSDWLDELLRFCLLPGVGVVGAKLLYPNGRVQHAGMVFGVHQMCAHVYQGSPVSRQDEFGSPEMYRNLLSVTGACQMLSRRVFEQIGGFDERYLLAFSDVALCLRAWKLGYRNVYSPHAALCHHEGYSRGRQVPTTDIETAARDLRAMKLREDPYFHPAFSSQQVEPTLRMPSEIEPRQALANTITEFCASPTARELQQFAEDGAQALLDAYLTRPDWQARFPDAASSAGWPEFCHWANEFYGLALEPRAPPGLRPLSASIEQQYGLNILGHFVHPCGLQTSAQSIADALQLAQIPVNLRDVPVGPGLPAARRRPYLGLETCDTTLVHIQPEPHVFGDEPFLAMAFRRAGLEPARHRYRIGMWYWEFGEAPWEWRRQAEALDELWAPTNFIAEALRKSMPIPVHSMLPGVRVSPFRPLPRSHFGIPADRYVFLFMYDMNGSQERKNPLGLVEAFLEAFRADDRALLVIKVSRGENNPQELARLKHAARQANAIIIDRVMSREESYALMRTCDCYVSLHRSEGLGLTMAEAMLMAKPVIATGYSGNLDFMTPHDSRLVGYSLVPLERDIHPYHKGWLWAEPSREEAARWMRWACDYPDEARELGLLGQQAALRVLSPEAAATRIDARLKAIRQLLAGDQANRRAA